MAGESDIQTLRESFFKDAVAGILVFASDDRQSYLSVRSLKEAAEKEARRSGVGRGTSIEWTLVQHKVDFLKSYASLTRFTALLSKTQVRIVGGSSEV